MSFVGYGNSLGFDTSFSTRITKPPGLIVGDVMVAVVFVRAEPYVGVDFVVPAGWTQIGTPFEFYNRWKPPSSAVGATRTAFYKFADAADVAAANFMFQWAPGVSVINDYTSGMIAAWRGPVSVLATGVSRNGHTEVGFVAWPDDRSAPMEIVSLNATAPNQLLVAVGDETPDYAPSGMTARTNPSLGDGSSRFSWDALTSAAGPTIVRPMGSNYMDFGFWTLLMNQNLPPLAPTLLSPPNAASAGLSGTPTFSWVHNDEVGSVQGGFVIRRKVGAGAYEYYNSGTGAWQSTIVAIFQTAQSFTFPAGKWTNGVTYNWSIATMDQYFALGAFATDRVTTSGQGPVVDVTGPVGVVSDTDSPQVGWTYFDAEGDLQTHYQLRVFTDAQYGIVGFDPNVSPYTWDSGELAGPWLSSFINTDLANNDTYRVYVRVKSAGQWSEWDYSQFTLTLLAPEKPIIEVLYEVSSMGPRNVLEGWGLDELGGAPAGLALDGTAYATTPDHASLDLVADLNFRVRVRATDLTSTTQTILAKWTAGQQSYILQIGVDGKLTIAWSTTGANTVTKTSTVAIPVADGVDFWLWVVLDVDNGGGGHTAYFSYSLDDTDEHAAVAWLLIGAPVAVAGVTSVFAGTAPLEIGSVLGGTANRFTGTIYDVVILNPALAAVFEAQFGDGSQGWESGDTGGATGVDSTGKTVTLVGTGADILALYDRNNTIFKFEYTDDDLTVIDPEDAEWFIVRGADFVSSEPGDQHATVYDYEMPPDATRCYRVTVIGELA